MRNVDAITHIELLQAPDETAHCVADWHVELEGMATSVHLARAVDNVTQAKASLYEVEVSAV